MILRCYGGHKIYCMCCLQHSVKGLHKQRIEPVFYVIVILEVSTAVTNTIAILSEGLIMQP